LGCRVAHVIFGAHGDALQHQSRLLCDDHGIDRDEFFCAGLDSLACFLARMYFLGGYGGAGLGRFYFKLRYFHFVFQLSSALDAVYLWKFSFWSLLRYAKIARKPTEGDHACLHQVRHMESGCGDEM